MKSALIVAGETLIRIQHSEKLRENFLNLAEKSSVVLACRVSPKQKADLVLMVR